MDLQLADQVFVLTGASRGLGFAAAQQLVADGAKVVLSARTADGVHAAVDRLGAEHAQAVVADLGDPQSAASLIGAAHERFGRLDGAFISVGGPPVGSAANITDEQWRAGFESVFLGAARLSRQVVADLLQRGVPGSILFVLSSSVKQPIANLTVSNGLRPGLAMLAKTMADEFGPNGIRVNGLLPGRIDTERLRQIDGASADPAAARAAAEQTIPLRRYGKPEEFGRAAAFLLSPAASYLSGVMLPVDGGMLRSL